MIRRSGNKIYTKVTQYFTDNNSPVGYSHSLTSPTESFCGTDFYYEERYTSSLANGKWRDCLYGPFTFCSGSTTSSACASGDCGQFYLDTATINIDYTGVMLDETSNVTLYTGSRLYLSSSLELAPDGYYVSGSTWYQVGTGNPYGYNAGTIISSSACVTGSNTIQLMWSVGTNNGGSGTLQVRNASGVQVLNESTAASTKSGTLYFTPSEVPFSITGSWSGGSGNIIRYRVCNPSVSGGELFYSGDIDNMAASIPYLVDPTPLFVSVHLTSGVSTYPIQCPI